MQEIPQTTTQATQLTATQGTTTDASTSDTVTQQMLQHLTLSHRAIKKNRYLCEAKGRVDWSHLDNTTAHAADAVNSSRTLTAASKGR